MFSSRSCPSPREPRRRLSTCAGFARARGAAGIAQLAFLCLVFASALSAQVTANLSGTVTDPSGATVSGAAVTVKNVKPAPSAPRRAAGQVSGVRTSHRRV